MVWLFDKIAIIFPLKLVLSHIIAASKMFPLSIKSPVLYLRLE